MSNLTRRQRESRAFTLTLTTGGLGLASVVTFILAIFGGSFGLFLLLLVLTGVSLFLLRGTMGRR